MFLQRLFFALAFQILLPLRQGKKTDILREERQKEQKGK